MNVVSLPQDGLSERDVRSVLAWTYWARDNGRPVTLERVVTDEGALSVTLLDPEGETRAVVTRVRGRYAVLSGDGRVLCEGRDLQGGLSCLTWASGPG